MPASLSLSYLCVRYLRARKVFKQPIHRAPAVAPVRRYANARPQSREESYTQCSDHHEREKEPQQDAGIKGEEEGALTRRLRSMSEEALESGGYAALKAVEEAGFNADLKAQLEQRIAAANLRSSEASIPDAASQHARDLATANSWTGTESIHDASLRMLNDAHKPMRLGRPPKLSGIEPPRSIDTGHKRGREGRGLRLANARDRSVVYTTVKDDENMEAEDRERRLQDLKDRFDPHARNIVPGTISGLASMANKRIEDAIARGQFKNIPRGKGKNVERDHNASSPFIDTTEYFMNKIIQKQEIVPPWIEKQQELTAAARKFRTRLRSDWKRHAARMIASKGGSLHDQIRRAEAYAKAELISNPLKKKQEVLSIVNDEGRMSQISLSGELKVIKPADDATATGAVVNEEIIAKKVALGAPLAAETQSFAAIENEDTTTQKMEVLVSALPPAVPPAAYPFRDPDWERIETAYWTVAIKDLNDKARSYNLQAPELAKRPYYNLQRELNSCFADVAPQLAGAILDRVRAPPKRAEGWRNHGEKSVLDSIVGGPVRVKDERTSKQYGLKQFWRDLWVDKSHN